MSSKKGKSGLFWLGKGVFSFGGKVVRHGERIPSDYPKDKLERLVKKGLVGEVMSKVAVNQGDIIVALKSEIEGWKNITDDQAKEKEELKATIGGLKEEIAEIGRNQPKLSGEPENVKNSGDSKG